ncbi:class I SAM-dependent methyltransferase [Metallibacterium scheffleri]|nr:class I SAM-dependent methyltransferase [Metallibacterium scheffleri]
MAADGMLATNDGQRKTLGQWMTPAWAAEELIARYFSDLSASDHVLEPSCGDGAFLCAVPDSVPVTGVEIDPVLAHRAAVRSGREVLVGDFLEIPLSCSPTLILGNPPFQQEIVRAFLRRAWSLLSVDGRCAFILPAYVFQTASVVDALAEQWSIQQEMIPRNLFGRIKLPLCFARFTKSGQRGTLVGFALYGEANAVTCLKRRYRALLAGGERSVWAAVTRAALESLGGHAALGAIYAEIGGARPTPNDYWREKVRQTLQRIACRVAPGVCDRNIEK